MEQFNTRNLLFSILIITKWKLLKTHVINSIIKSKKNKYAVIATSVEHDLDW